ncbi:hypothetical protein QQ054_01090 [Oscillatoria amoena NRMC-F 0135]|nr:hypothetical protein [Oscillatoria amoena NRMC-F 0135]
MPFIPYTFSNFPDSGTSQKSTQDELLLSILNAVSEQLANGDGAEIHFELSQELTLIGGAYVSGQTVGTSAGTLNFTTDTENNHTVEIRSIRLYTDDVTNTPQYRINWFQSAPTGLVDKTTFSVNYAQATSARRKRSTLPVMSITSGHGYAEDFTNWFNIATTDSDNKIYFALQTLTTGNISAGAKLTVIIEGFVKRTV